MSALRLFNAFRACALALCWSLLQAGMAQAAPQDPTGRLLFQSYGREVGLGSLRINLLVQDRPGFIWAGTDRGLYRFDGQRFRAFGLAEGLPSLEVNALALDAQGQLWVGSSGGLSRWGGQKFEAATGFPSGLKVNDLSLGPDGALWAASDRGAWRHAQAGWAQPAGPGPAAPDALALGPAETGTLWAATRDRLWTWTADRGWRGAQAQLRLAAGERLDRLAFAGDGSLFVRTARATYRLPPGAAQFEHLADLPRAEVFLSRMSTDAEGGLWLPTEHGLSRWQGGSFSHWSLADGLPTEFARAVLTDREGGLWVGSLGLHRLLGLGAWRTHTAKQGLPADVWSMLRDGEGWLWVGTGKGLAQARGRQGWAIVRGTEGHALRSLVQEPGGALLLGGEPIGLLRWDPAAQRLSPIDGLPAEGRKVMAMLFDGEALWVGTQRAGLVRGARVGSGWRFAPEPLPEVNRVNDLHRDARGRLWVASNAGLFLREAGAWRRFGRAEGLLSEQVLYLGAGAGSRDLWLAYRDVPGAVTQWRLDERGGSVGRHLQPPLLPAQAITLVGEDGAGRLWVGGNQGLEMLADPRAAQPAAPVHFGVERGLVDEETNARAFLADPDGTLWIGTRGGLAQFDSRRFEGDPRQLGVVLLDARLGEQVLPLAGNGSPLRVGHRDNVLQASFASLSFTDPAGVDYQARLIGLEPEWHDANTRELRYAGLSPGRYRLELRARYRLGDWGPVTALDFEVQPPWWQTPWFRLMLGAGLLLGLLGWRQQQLRRHRRETERLQALVAERTEALAQANAALREQSLTDPLTGLRNRRFLEEAMREHAALAQRTRSNARGAPGLVLMLLDVDHFKAVNDTHGHAAGDAVLVQMAQRLRTCTRESDLLVRWGGEEFAIAAHAASLAQGTQLAERIRSAVEAQDFDLGGGVMLPVRCSLGLVPFPWGAAAQGVWPWQRLMELADACLYAAKRSGRNRWVAVQPGAGFAAEPATDLAAALPAWVRSGQLELLASGDAPVAWD